MPIFADLVARYRTTELPMKAPKTQENYNFHLDRLLPLWGEKPIEAIKRIDCADLHANISATGHKYAANRVLGLVRRLFQLAIEWEWCTSNPAARYKRNPEPPRTRFLSEAEIARLLAALAQWQDAKTESCLMILLLLLTGCRLGELLGATWGMFDLDREMTWTKPDWLTKTKRVHVLPVSPEVVSLLKEWRSKAGTVPLPTVRVFNNGDTKARIERDWRVIRASAELNAIRLHDMRHAHATILIRNGMSLQVVSKLLGHSSITMSARYAHLELEPQRKGAGLVGKLVGNTGL